MNRPATNNNLVSLGDMRKDAARIFQAGIDAANPYQAVKRCLSANNDHIEILLDIHDSSRKRLGKWTQIHLIAFGKAACAMAKAASEIIPEKLICDTGIAVTHYQNETEIAHFEVIKAGHPLPDQAGIKGAKIILQHVERAQQNELVLVLISGGGSALVPYPIDLINLEDKIQTTELLLSCGANISQINCVRKHLSLIKGGGLARVAAPADLHALILSDVIGDNLSTIASGPTVPDDTTFYDAIKILKTKQLWDKIPKKVQFIFEQGLAGKIRETPKSGDSVFAKADHTLIGSNAISVNAIMSAAKEHGYEIHLYSDKLCGEARGEAEKLVKFALKFNRPGLQKPIALLAGGETTVNLTGTGLGGRNQEMALTFVLAAKRQGLSYNWVFLSGGTDGRDGPTDAAGGLVDSNTYSRMTAAGVSPIELLNNNDSHTALRHSRDLLVTGATGTNVADLQVLLIHPLNSN